MERYSIIDKGLKREFILLQGNGCRWRKCSFCDYHSDVSDDPFAINKPVLEKVSGIHGVLDIINSGSCFELDKDTLKLIQHTVRQKGIRTLWFECHWMYHGKLEEFRSLFPGTEVKFRCGVETFNAYVREKLWHKGIGMETSAEEIAKHFNGICLLCGVKGQSREDILRDIELAERFFEYYSLNLFCPNSTAAEVDEDLAYFVRHDIRKMLEKSSKAELLIENTDLGVG